jgi:hypothetical protein
MDLLSYLREEVTDDMRYTPKKGRNPRREKYLDGRQDRNRKAFLFFNNRRKPFSYNGVVEKRYHLDTFEGHIHGKSSRLMMHERASWWEQATD